MVHAGTGTDPVPVGTSWPGDRSQAALTLAGATPP